MSRNILILAALSLFFTAPVIAQKKKLAICAEAESKLIETLVGAQPKRRDAYRRDCRFAITYGNEKISVGIKIFDSEEESKAEFPTRFDRLTVDAYDPPFGEQPVDLNGSWNEAKGFKTDDSDHLVLLRYNRTHLALIGSNYNLLLSIEPLLRTLNFRAYEEAVGDD